jgi:hypothetical protein
MSCVVIEHDDTLLKKMIKLFASTLTLLLLEHRSRLLQHLTPTVPQP